MKSTAEELMDFCESKGVGKVGELLYFTRVFDENKARQEAIIFIDTENGEYARRLGGVAYETDYVDVHVRSDTPGRAYELSIRVLDALESIKGYASKNKTKYHYALAQNTPRLLMYARGDVYVYSTLYRVMRNTQRA